MNSVHLTEDDVWNRVMSKVEESIAKVHWIDKYKTELVKFENKGFVEDMEDIAGGGGMNLNNEPDARGVGEKKLALKERRERFAGHGEDMEDFPQEVECKAEGGGGTLP